MLGEECILKSEKYGIMAGTKITTVYYISWKKEIVSTHPIVLYAAVVISWAHSYLNQWVWGRTPKNPELSSGSVCISVPTAVIVRGCIWLQWIFFLRQHICPFHDGWFTSTPDQTALSDQQFLTKDGMIPVPTLPIHLISPKATFLFPQVKKFLKGKCFAHMKEVKQKTAEALKGIKIDKFKNCFEQRKSISIGVEHQMENTLKVTET